jgi:hypothetical protein
MSAPAYALGWLLVPALACALAAAAHHHLADRLMLQPPDACWQYC